MGGGLKSEKAGVLGRGEKCDGWDVEKCVVIDTHGIEATVGWEVSFQRWRVWAGQGNQHSSPCRSHCAKPHCSTGNAELAL